MGRRRGLSHHGRGTEFSRHGAGRETARLRRAGMHPHFLFETSKRKCAVHGGKEKMFRAKRHFVLFCLCTGVPTRNCPVNFQSKRWARAQPCRIFQLVPRDELSANFGVVVVWLLLLFPRSPLRSALPVLNPGRGRSPSPLSRFKGARGKSKSPPPGFSLGGRGGTLLFSKEKCPLPPSPLRRGRNSYAIMTPIVKFATVSMRKYRISFLTYFSHRS